MTDRNSLLAWQKKLNQEDRQRVQEPLSAILKRFTGIKEKDQKYVCRISPCSKHQYARGVCQRHYSQLRRISKVVGWGQISALGLCEVSGLRDIVRVRITHPDKEG